MHLGQVEVSVRRYRFSLSSCKVSTYDFFVNVVLYVARSRLLFFFRRPFATSSHVCSDNKTKLVKGLFPFSCKIPRHAIDLR
jgi:hypothetical protein